MLPSSSPIDSPDGDAGPTCARSGLPVPVRFLLLFGISFGLKMALPYSPLGPVVQMLLLASVVSLLVWRLWASCSAGARGPLAVMALVWIATLVKIALR